MALASGAGPGCWPHLASVLRADAVAAAAAGRGHGPGLPARRVPASAPRRPVSATAAGAGADPCYPEPKENRAKVCREVLHSQLAVPCLSLLPKHPAYFLNIQ